VVGTVLVRSRQEALANGANASYLRMMEYMSLQQRCGTMYANVCLIHVMQQMLRLCKLFWDEKWGTHVPNLNGIYIGRWLFSAHAKPLHSSLVTATKQLSFDDHDIIVIECNNDTDMEYLTLPNMAVNPAFSH